MTNEALDRPENTNIDLGFASVNIGILWSISHHIQCLISQQLYNVVVAVVLFEQLKHAVRCAMIRPVIFDFRLNKPCVIGGHCRQVTGYTWTLIYDVTLTYHPPVKFVPIKFPTGCACML